ncbi:hypothetical protein MNBD_DELTA04-1638 [hydrothermal vent metagenome]|uniref:General secretion pathway protein M n=1 Tax=hydrothermal vent metagenome TaxID=652676 RepID=A0A3B0VTM0_9ZZZZ
MKQLARRERLALIAGGVFVALFVVMQFGVFPVLDHWHRLQRDIKVREKAVVEMRDLQSRYRRLHGKANSLTRQLSRRPPDFSLFSFLEKTAAQAGVKQSIAYMKPSATTDDGALQEMLVEMKLRAVSLQQLVDFLRLVESPENVVAIKRIAIQQNTKEESTLDVIMQVVSLKLATAAAGEQQGSR